MISVDLPDGTGIRNVYDADGVRIAAAYGSGGASSVTRYVTDTSGPLSQVLAELGTAGASAGEPAVSYIRRGEELLGLLRADQPRYVHADHLGSVRALTDPGALVKDRYAFAAFGELVEHVGEDPNPFLFAGQWRDDATGLDYLRARWLDPSQGRFVSMDPLGGILFQVGGLHRYVYGLNDPVDRIDPSGLESVASQISSLAISVGVRVQTAGLRALSAFAGGASAGWRFLRELGAYAERVARQVVTIYNSAGSALVELELGVLRLGRVKYVPDFLLRSASGLRVALLEVKWNLPWARTSAAMLRLVEQVRFGLQSGVTSEVVVWSLKYPTVAQTELLRRTLGINYQFVRVVHGVNGLFLWLNQYFGKVY